MTNHDSAYSLLSRFAHLNGLGARDLLRLFISRHLGIKGQTVRRAQVDLRDPDLFDSDLVASLTGASRTAVEQSFVLPTLAHDRGGTDQWLRYCPLCMAYGFHTPLFQLAHVARCPVHHRQLRRACPRCKGLLSYQLNSSMFYQPFGCPHCGASLAPRLDHFAAWWSSVTAEDRQKLIEARELGALKARLLGSAFQLDRAVAFHGESAVSISAPSLDRRQAEYCDFVDALLRELGASASREASGEALIVTLCKTHFEPMSRRGPRRTSKSAQRHPLLAAWADEKLLNLAPIYGAIRRHLWRHVVGRHQRCVCAAARHFWWRPEGTSVPAFCPVAYAFLRWRAYWEGVSIPQDLFRAPTHAPYLLLAWLSSAAPLCPPRWSGEGEAWLAHRIYALDCTRSFSYWLELALRRWEHGRIEWTRRDAKDYTLTYWAAAGGERAGDPLRVYFDANPVLPMECPGVEDTDAHFRWHLGQIQQARRYRFS